MVRRICSLILLAVVVCGCGGQVAMEKKDLVAPETQVQKLAGGFRFTEGPVADDKGNVFFTDIPNSRIHKWSPDGKVEVFLEDSGKANGLYFDKAGNLLACIGGRGHVVSIDANRKITVIADKYKGKPFNSPNDLWIDPKGGIYFTDPRYGNRDNLPQDGEHVYYLYPDRSNVIRVVDDMVRPNGIIGTKDGKTLYVTDNGGKMTYKYRIEKNGTLSGKILLAELGSDGMTIDIQGNIYLTTNKVVVYCPDGTMIAEIDVPEGPANVCFGGPGNKTLFITARTSLYSLQMKVPGMY